MEEQTVMKNEFTIKYRFHWCGSCLRYDDTKSETVIYSDGTVLARNYDHHGTNGHYRIVERAKGFLPKEEAERLFQDLMNLVYHHDRQINTVTDAITEVEIETPGMKISLAAGISDGQKSCESLIIDLLADIVLSWESVI